jgi:hypothetical protein
MGPSRLCQNTELDNAARMFFGALVAVALAVGGCASSLKAVAQPAPLSVCDLRGKFASYKGRLVRVSGILSSDGTHYTGIASPACPEVVLPLALSLTKPIGYDEVWGQAEKNRSPLDTPIYVVVEGWIVNDPARGNVGLSATRYTLTTREAVTPP